MKTNRIWATFAQAAAIIAASSEPLSGKETIAILFNASPEVVDKAIEVERVKLVERKKRELEAAQKAAETAKVAETPPAPAETPAVTEEPPVSNEVEQKAEELAANVDARLSLVKDEDVKEAVSAEAAQELAAVAEDRAATRNRRDRKRA